MLTYVERLKLRLLDTGLAISPNAREFIDEHNEGRPLTPADYASTSGVILQLDGEIWVNARRSIITRISLRRGSLAWFLIGVHPVSS